MALEVCLPSATRGARTRSPRAPSTPVGLLAGGLGALLMLVVGEVAPGLFPLRVTLSAQDSTLQITADGSQHVLARAGLAWDHLQFDQPRPEDREVQIDGSETVGRGDREPDDVRALAGTPAYALASWLRDDASFSRWDDVRVFDADTGAQVADGRPAAEAVTLPARFRIEASLRHPEAPARIWLTARDQAIKDGLQIERNEHSLAWVRDPPGGKDPVRWFFPLQAAPFAANLLQLAGRAAAAAYILVAGVVVFGSVPALYAWRRPLARVDARLAAAALALTALAGSVWISWALYHQLPHMLDATNYYVQAGMFLTGHLWFEPPPLPKAFTLYNQVLWEHRWFVQYPPGAPSVYALGRLLGVAWLVGPLAALAMVLCTAYAAHLWFGRRTALAALGLGALSPFVLFQAGTFMSHPIAGAALGGALAAFAHAERSGRRRLFVVAGAGLGFAFLTREYSAVLFGIPLVGWLVWHRNWRALPPLIAAGVPFLVAYMAYNGAVTRDPLRPPRWEVNPADRPGFGPEHTLALGLVFADQDLNDLQFELFGWPPLLSLSAMAAPFVLGKAGRRDVLLGAGALLMVGGFVAVDPHGIGAMGPRYYYEGLPWFVVLAARGLQAAAATAGQLGLSRTAARAGAAGLLVMLTLYAGAFYLPGLIERRSDFAALAGGRRLAYSFVESTPVGPKLAGFAGPTAVLVGDDKLFQNLAALNCPLLDGDAAQTCPVVFLHAGEADLERVAAAYPGRAMLRAEARDGRVILTDLAR